MTTTGRSSLSCTSLSNAVLLQRALAAFEEHKIMIAGQYLSELDGRDPTGQWMTPDSKVSMKLESLRRLYHRVTTLRESLVSDEGWELQRDKNGIRCMYQAHESGFVRIRMDAEVDAPLFDLIALLREVDLWDTWVPSFMGLGLSDSRQLGETSILNMCFHAEVTLPRPFSKRCCSFAVDGIDCMNEQDAPQQVVILLDSNYAQSNCKEQLTRVEESNTVNISMWDSGIIMTPPEVAGTRHTFMQCIVCVDPKMSIPKWLVNIAVKNFCFLLVVQIRSAVAATRKPAHLRKTTDPDNHFYAFIRRRMGESLPSQLALAPPVARASDLSVEPCLEESCFARWCGCFPRMRDKHCTSATTAYQIANEHCEAPPRSLTIRGATGDNRDVVNGIYDIFVSHDDSPCWIKRSDKALVLVRVNGKWMVTNSGRIDKNVAVGWACSSKAISPVFAKNWLVLVGSGKWESQSVVVSEDSINNEPGHQRSLSWLAMVAMALWIWVFWICLPSCSRYFLG